MRVIVPTATPEGREHEGPLHPLADAALVAHAPEAERIFVGHNVAAYYELVAQLWEQGESFLLVERDIEIHDGVLRAMTYCPRPWCLFAYGGPSRDLLTGSLGCTRFRGSLMAAEPDLLIKVGTVNDGQAPIVQKDWRRLDTRMLHELAVRGYSAHVHKPPVKHHHNYPQYGCACGEEHE